MFKRAVEYKANLYSVFLEQFFYMASLFIMFNILFTNFGSVIGWNFKDFILFMILADFLWIFIGMIVWRDWLKYDIIKGNFNLYILKPFNTFYFYFTFLFSHYALIYVILTFFIYSGFIIYFQVELFNIFLGLLVMILIGIFSVAFIEFIRSLDWLFLGFSMAVWSSVWHINNNLKNYPAQFFGKSTFRFFLLIFPNYFVAVLLIPIFRGYEVSEFWFLIKVLISLTFIFILGIYFVWKYGLKNYEAFG